MKRTIAFLTAVLLSTIAASCPAPGPKPPIPPTPSAPLLVDIVLCQTAATVHCDYPIGGVPVHLHVATQPDVYVDGVTNAGGYYAFTVPPNRRPLPDSDVHSDATANWEAGSRVVHPEGPDACSSISPKECHNFLTLTAAWPQPQDRPPLVLEPNDPGTGDVCPHIPPTGFAFPAGPDRRFWRGDAWGVTVHGLPWVAGGSARHPERALSWFLDRWAPSWQQVILEANRARGYTHFTLSWPDSRDGAGQSAADFAATAVRVHQGIPFVNVMLTSKDFDPPNMDAGAYMARVTPAIEALIAAGFTGDDLILTVGWELDAFNEGQRLEDSIHALHARYPQFDLYVHFTTYKTSWQPDGQPRAQFWQATRGELTGLLYQGNQNDPCGLMAAHFNDAQIPASGLEAAGAILVPWELVAANEYDNDHPNEDDANARNWSIMMTPGRILASGFGNGSRQPNGKPTLQRYPDRGVR